MDEAAANVEESKRGQADVRAVAARMTLAPAVAALGGIFALTKLLTTFRIYDDEGYLLLSLKHYLSDGHLYTGTFTQYGPFYFFAQWIFFRVLHVPVTHDGARFITLVYWLASAVFAGLFVQKISKSLLLGAAAGLGCVVAGTFLANEPGHPQQLLFLLWMASAYITLARTSGRSTLRFFLLGAMGAALLFTKVNAGVFYLAALGHALLCMMKPGWFRSLGVSLGILYAVGFPYLLMHSDFYRGSEGYCLVAILCGASTFAIGSLARPADPYSPRAILYVASGLSAASLFIVIAGWMQGISLATLIRGVVLGPMRLRNVYYFPFVILRDQVQVAAMVTAGLAFVWFLRQRRDHLGVRAGVDLIRCAAGIGTCLAIVSGSPPVHWLFALLPLSLIRGVKRNDSTRELFPRLFLTNLVATEFLLAYPVAGSHIAMTSSLLLLWAFLCIGDGVNGLAEAWGQYGRAVGYKFRLGLVVASVLLLVVGEKAVSDTSATLRNLPARSTLPGSSLLHLAPDQEKDYEFLSHSIAANCTVLFSMPGMDSFNFWSGVPAPNGSNHNAWMKSFDAERQQKILDVLQATPGACVVYNPTLVRFWHVRQEELSAMPLAQYILLAMPKVAARGDYEIRVHPQRQTAWRSPDS